MMRERPSGLLIAFLSVCMAFLAVDFLSGCALHPRVAIGRHADVGGKQALLVASYAYVSTARDAADRIRAGRMTEAQADRARALGARVRDALVAAHDVADGFSRARRIEEALAATAELVAIVEEGRP